MRTRNSSLVEIDLIQTSQNLQVENLIDSLFVDNCVAVLGFNKFKLLSKDYTIIPDNDRRNPDVLKSKQRIEDGYNVVKPMIYKKKILTI